MKNKDTDKIIKELGLFVEKMKQSDDCKLTEQQRIDLLNALSLLQNALITKEPSQNEQILALIAYLKINLIDYLKDEQNLWNAAHIAEHFGLSSRTTVFKNYVGLDNFPKPIILRNSIKLWKPSEIKHWFRDHQKRINNAKSKEH